MAKAASVIASGAHTITPQFMLDQAAGAIERYKKASVAEETDLAKTELEPRAQDDCAKMARITR